MIGGPNPDGRYLLAMIRGDRTYRVTGKRGTTAYLGFQVLAGTGLTPRRMAAYVSDTDLARCRLIRPCFSAAEPTGRTSAMRSGCRSPTDASAIVVREYIGDQDAEQPASMDIESLDARGAATDHPMLRWPSSSPRWRGPS